MEYVTLNNGIVIAQMGIGTFGINEINMGNAITTAVSEGYRLFDTSPNYNNDVSLGKAIKNLSIDRSKLFLIEKVETEEQRHSIRAAVDGCLERLGVEYIDMYLIHWPYPNHYIKTWKQMERIYEEGLIKTIGVCNCKKHHLESLLNKANIIPAVNQIEMHPLYTQKDTVEFCEANSIKIMAYTPLARMNSALMGNELLNKLSKKYEKSLPQIILRWDVQCGFIVLPKSENALRIKQNIDIFDFKLTDEEVGMISGLNKDFRVRFDPDDRSRYPKPFYQRVIGKIRKIVR